MKKNTNELNIIRAFKSLSELYANLYTLVELEEIFFNYSKIEYLNYKTFELTWEYILDEEQEYDASDLLNIEYEEIEEKYLNSYIEYDSDLEFLEKSIINRENIQECKDIILDKIKLHKETLRGF